MRIVPGLGIVYGMLVFHFLRRCSNLGLLFAAKEMLLAAIVPKTDLTRLLQACNIVRVSDIGANPAT